MTGETQASTPFALTAATLRVRDAVRVADFYMRALGLERAADGPDGLVLASAGAPRLRLIEDSAAPARRPATAGLFHLAFLLEDRAALGRALQRIAAAGFDLSGAADHAVSEAVYLDDPEGGGVEIYVDRPRALWRRLGDGTFHLPNAPLDLQALLDAARAAGAPSGPDAVRLGHVHLEVGDVARAQAFYEGAFPFETQARRTAAAFLGADGYHHHLGLNSWRAAGAGPRAPEALGLVEIGFAADTPNEVVDPWGTVWRGA